MLLHLASRGTLEMFTLYKMIFYFKFLSLTENKNKIDNIKL